VSLRLRVPVKIARTRPVKRPELHQGALGSSLSSSTPEFP
jgi:hypothetical protein